MQMTKFLLVLNSSPTKEESRLFSEALLEERLVSGCLITEGAAQYWWAGSVVDKEYWNVQAFSIEEYKEKIIAKIEAIASDDCPIIAFFEMDGNSKFLDWIKESLRS